MTGRGSSLQPVNDGTPQPPLHRLLARLVPGGEASVREWLRERPARTQGLGRARRAGAANRHTSRYRAVLEYVSAGTVGRLRAWAALLAFAAGAVRRSQYTAPAVAGGAALRDVIQPNAPPA